MTRFYVLAVLIFFISHLAFAEEVLFQRGSVNHVTETNRCAEVKALRPTPPHFIVDKDGFLTYEGDGDFGLVFVDQKFLNFQLDLEVTAPVGNYEYANSGIFFRAKDPRRLDHPGIPDAIVQLAKTRTPGFVAEWSSYEVQLLAGTIAGAKPNQSNGAFYGIEEGSALGLQTRSEFRFDPGQTYQVRLVARGEDFKVYMKWALSAEYVLVSQMTNVNPARSSEPGYVGIQSYYSNGANIRALRFGKISIQELN